MFSKRTVKLPADLSPYKRESKVAEERMILKWPSVDNG